MHQILSGDKDTAILGRQVITPFLAILSTGFPQPEETIVATGRIHQVQQKMKRSKKLRIKI